MVSLQRRYELNPRSITFWNEVANLLGPARRNELKVKYNSGILHGDDLDREVAAARPQPVQRPLLPRYSGISPNLDINTAPYIGVIRLNLTGRKDFFDNDDFVDDGDYVMLKGNTRYIFKKDGLRSWFESGNKVVPGTTEQITQNDIQHFTYQKDLTKGGRRRKSRRIMNRKKKTRRH